MCDEIKHFDKMIASAEYHTRHTRGLYSPVILTPREYIPKGHTQGGENKWLNSELE